ncbi:hypothetical protein BH09MYX1_BH09MYX1_48870 [soil metagenome]
MRSHQLLPRSAPVALGAFFGGATCGAQASIKPLGESDFPWGKDIKSAFAACGFGTLPGPAGSSDCRPSTLPNYFVKDVAGGLQEFVAATGSWVDPPYLAVPYEAGVTPVCGHVSYLNSSTVQSPFRGLRCCSDPVQ